MAQGAKAVKVSLVEDGFCVATGPHDESVLYPCAVGPFAPVLLDSPVALHLYCPELFPGEVLKVHAEHLGHFTALLNLPRLNREMETCLILGLCKLFTVDRVFSVYRATLSEETLEKLKMYVPCAQAGEPTWYPNVFVDPCAEGRPLDLQDPDEENAQFHARTGKRAVPLLRGLLALFDLSELRGSPLAHTPGETPQHALFLFLIQLLAVYVSSRMDDADLATVLAVASAPYLERNFCDPLCAATLLKPVFVPYYETYAGAKAGRGKRPVRAAEAQPKHYKLFTGYKLDKDGADVSCCLDESITWTDHDISQRAHGHRLVERSNTPLWFVAPQLGDRLQMAKGHDATDSPGVKEDRRTGLIRAYLMCDNVIAYAQCALFGTVWNMLPCHAHSDFNDVAMRAVNNSMTALCREVRRHSANLMNDMSKSNTCAGVDGVAFSSQDSGKTLLFGRVFTGPHDKCPEPDKTKPGVFTSVTLGRASTTAMAEMLKVALRGDDAPRGSRRVWFRNKPATPHGSPYSLGVANNFDLYGLYHHRFNRGECTEVACVKSPDDRYFNSLIHKSALNEDSKYQLTLTHGALPMCTLTLAMTMRQTSMMVVGFLLAHVARLVYASKQNDAVAHNVTSLAMAGAFRHGKDDESDNTLEATFGNLVKVTGKVFSKAGSCGPNFADASLLEWLSADDLRLPDYLRASLRVIGDTKAEVEKLMQQEGLSYSRVMFVCNGRRVGFASAYEHEECMVQAPLLVKASMRVFSNSSKSHGSLKLYKLGTFYYVGFFSNHSVDTKQYVSQSDCGFITESEGGEKDSVEEIVAKIVKNVSRLMPRINLSRVKSMARHLDETQFRTLVSAVRAENVEVGEQVESCCPGPESCTADEEDELGYDSGPSDRSGRCAKRAKRSHATDSEETEKGEETGCDTDEEY